MRLALTILNVILAIGVIVTITLQSSKSEGLGALGGGSKTLFSQKKSRDELLQKLATYLVISWMGLTLILSVLNRRLG